MEELQLRRANIDDAPFLARAIVEADRGHTGIGSWDIALPGADAYRLNTLAALVRASTVSYLHWSTFLVAELGGVPVGTVAGYVPSQLPPTAFDAACAEALGDATAVDLLATRGAWSRNYFGVTTPPDALRVEWVYTAETARRRGVSASLLGRLLRQAEQDRVTAAYVGTYIGNHRAISTYERLGFLEFATCRHHDYEEQFRSPGLVLLRRTLRPPQPAPHRPDSR